MKRVFAVLTISSAVVCCLALILLPVSYALTLVNDDLTAQDSVAVTSQWRCGIAEGSVWLFSHEYPYRGSLRFLGDGRDGVYYDQGHARVNQDWSCGASGCGLSRVSYTADDSHVVGRDLSADFPGVYYRHFAGMGETQPTWTLRVSLWYPILAFAICPAVWILRCGGARRFVTSDQAIVSATAATSATHPVFRLL